MPQSRLALDFDTVVNSFLSSCREENEGLARDLELLDKEGRQGLAGVLGRFDRRGGGELDPAQRLMARRILGRLRRPSTATLALLNRILDYLDFDADSRLNEEETGTCIEILERFSRIDSDNSSLSEKELRMLYAVLRGIDADSSLSLDSRERGHLKRALADPNGFLAEQKAHNPRLREVLGLP